MRNKSLIQFYFGSSLVKNSDTRVPELTLPITTCKYVIGKEEIQFIHH